MINIEVLKFEIADVLKRLSEGERIFRINLDGMSVSELGEKSVKTIMRDERKYPDKYVYFVEEKEEEIKAKMFICDNTGLKCIFCCPGACIARKIREL